jgi:transposase
VETPNRPEDAVRPAPRKYPDELRERAICLVLDIEEETGNITAACRRIGEELGIDSDTLRGWVKRAQVDSGVSSSDAGPDPPLERETPSFAGPTRSCAPRVLFSPPSWVTTDHGDRFTPASPFGGGLSVTGLPTEFSGAY